MAKQLSVDDMLMMADDEAAQNESNATLLSDMRAQLDLVFAMDCTGSMTSYINRAQQTIRLICEEIVSKEQADIRLALVEYRDHPPQDRTFVTRIHGFTPSVGHMKAWLDQCLASGGGDTPEAVADALEAVRALTWRPNATKICVFIADAPPHGLGPVISPDDSLPNGCPLGLDPMRITRQIAEQGIKIYMVGCEPSINTSKEFYMALCHLTGGQYVPLKSATLLAEVIVGGAQEELSLQRLMEEVNRQVLAEAAGRNGHIDVDLLGAKVHSKLSSSNVMTKQLHMNNSALPAPTAQAKAMSGYNCLEDVRADFSRGSCLESSNCPIGHPTLLASAPARSMGGLGGAPPPRIPPQGHTDLLDLPPPEASSMLGPDPFAPPFNAPCDFGAVPQSAAPSPFSTSTPCFGASVDVQEKSIDLAQAQRMVQTSMMTGGLHDRIKKN